MAGIEHYAELAAGSDYADRLVHRPLGIGRVVKHSPRVDEVEARVRKGEAFGISCLNVAVEPFQLEPASYELHRVLGEVDSGDLRAGPRKTDQIATQPDADLQHLLPARALEVREIRDLRVELVPRTRDLLEEFWSALGGLRVGGAAGLVLPEALDATLRFLGGGRSRAQRLNRTVSVRADTCGMNQDVTVVIACFNYGRFLLEAVDSALKEGAQVIVVDDGSTEALPELPAVVDLIRQENQGVARARNTGLAKVETPYALVLDADDRLVGGALETLRAPLEANPKLGFAYGRMRFFGDWEGELRFPPYDAYTLLYRHTIGLSALARREVFQRTGGFDPEFEQFEDWEHWVHALAHGWQGRQIDAVTVEYRRHSGSKHWLDRRSYRKAFRRLREKHKRLYLSKRPTRLGRLGRTWYRYFWGFRPVPAVVELALHRLRWGAKETG